MADTPLRIFANGQIVANQYYEGGTQLNGTVILKNYANGTIQSNSMAEKSSIVRLYANSQLQCNSFFANVGTSYLTDASTITYNLNVTANVSNTRNLAVTQNTFTGNLVVVSQTNVATINVSSTANLAVTNVLGVFSANASPLSILATITETGICAVKTVATACTSSTTLAADNYLQLNFNETGKYKFELLLAFCANNTSSNGYNGFKYDISNNTAITANQAIWAKEYSNAATQYTLTNNLMISGNAVSGKSNCSTTIGSPSYAIAGGFFDVTTVGYVGVRWSQALSSANAVYLLPGSYFKAVKIG